MKNLKLVSNFLVSVLLLTACGGGGEESSTQTNNSPTACELEQCTNLDNAKEIVINDNVTKYELLGGETIGTKFNATVGNEYKIHAIANVGYSIYITDSNPLIPSKALLRDFSSFGGDRENTFQAKKTAVHYVVVKLETSTTKVEASIRVTSRKENLTPLTGTDPLTVNNIRTEISLIPGEMKRWYFEAKQGKTYHIYQNGEFYLYSSVIPSVDKYENDDRVGSDGSISFQAKESQKIFIAALDAGKGSDGHVRVYSYDEPTNPLGGETSLILNAAALQFDINPKEYKRFMFNSEIGKDYTVLVTELQGSIGAYLSVLPSVDGHIYEKRDSDCNCKIVWREAESKRWYLAVGNGSSTTAGKFTVQVTKTL